MLKRNADADDEERRATRLDAARPYHVTHTHAHTHPLGYLETRDGNGTSHLGQNDP